MKSYRRHARVIPPQNSRSRAKFPLPVLWPRMAPKNFSLQEILACMKFQDARFHPYDIRAKTRAQNASPKREPKTRAQNASLGSVGLVAKTLLGAWRSRTLGRTNRVMSGIGVNAGRAKKAKGIRRSETAGKRRLRPADQVKWVRSAKNVEIMHEQMFTICSYFSQHVKSPYVSASPSAGICSES